MRCKFCKPFVLIFIHVMGGGGYLLNFPLLAFRDEDHLGRIIADRGTVEVSVKCRNPEAATREQVLDLITEKIPQGPRKDEPLFAAVRMNDGINHLHVINLFGAVKG